MSYPKKIIKLEPAGYNPDQPTQDGTQWEVGTNMTSSAGKTITVPGWTQVYGNTFNNVSNAQKIQALENLETSASNFWVYHGCANSWVVVGDTHTDITIANGWSSNVTTPTYWSSGVLNGITFVNNRVDKPAYWDGNTSNKLVTLPDWSSTARTYKMVAHKNYLFALGIENNTGVYPVQIAWSDAAPPGEVPQSWTASATTDAGSTILAESGGAIVTAKSLRDTLIIYKQRATYSCRYIGGESIFQFDTLFTNKGALNAHSVADINGAHFVVGDGSVYITDGTQYQDIADGFVKSTLFGQLTSNTVDQLFVIYKPSTHSVQVNFPALGSNTVDTCLEYNLNDKLWGSRELNPMNPVTAAIGIVSDETSSGYWNDANTAWDDNNVFWNTRNFSTAATSIVYASEKLYKGEIGATKNGASILFTGILTNIDFEDPSRVKYVKAIYPSIYGEPGTIVNFRIGSSKSVDGSISWSGSIPYEVGVDDRVECRVQGKQISIEISTTGQILLNSIALEADMRGYR